MSEIKSYGKYNLFLKVYKKRKKNVYHRTKTLIIPYQEMYDVIKIESAPKFSFVELKKIIDPKDNTVISALKYFFNEHPTVDKKIKVELIKNLPVGSGLGYSASNGVATYKLLHTFYNLPLTEVSSLKFVNWLADDAIFFLYETPVWIEKYGIVVRPFTKKINYNNFKIIVNNLSCITSKVYEQFDSNYRYYAKNFVMHSSFCNYLELPCLDLYPELYDKYLKLSNKYQYVMISGSGSAFICFDDAWSLTD